MIKHYRFKTHVVNIGDTALGGTYPIRVQSMLNTNTLDTKACLKQAIALIEKGCEYVRITVPGMKEAQNLAQIKSKLRGMGYTTPLIADVHFKPEVAEYCARFTEKVRINPGNYADKKAFKQKDYSDKDYKAELERIAERFTPLLRICKEYGTAIRIGTNHGSLSDRIINRFGDTPTGMVESTMEFLRISRDLGFNNIVVSLKASNPLIMIEANRLLIKQMVAENMRFPLHLGVTEAGEGEDGRIKSALGIGTLLEEGIGDTIRVSLTENPVNEIPFARLLADEVNSIKNINYYDSYIPPVTSSFLGKVAPGQPPQVIVKQDKTDDSTLRSLFSYNRAAQVFERHFNSPDMLHITKKTDDIMATSSFKIITSDFMYGPVLLSGSANLCREAGKIFIVKDEDDIADLLATYLKKNKNTERSIFLKVKYNDSFFDGWLAHNTVHYAPLLMNKLIDGFYVDANSDQTPLIVNALFGMMQACRVRISRTEYISCPTCGRTSFDMEDTLKAIKNATSHLQGLKIGVMGCIVNGPGEMADADYGYVGTASGKVNLYKGKKAVQKNIDKEKALDALICLLKADGVWKDK